MHLRKLLMLLSVLAVSAFIACDDRNGDEPTAADAKYTQKAVEAKMGNIETPPVGKEQTEASYVNYTYKVGDKTLSGRRKVDTQTATALNSTPGITVCYDPNNVTDSLMIQYGANCPPKKNERNP